MTRHLQNLEILTEKTLVSYFFDQKIWFHWFDFQREPEVPKEIAIRNHRRGERVTSDLAMELLFNSGSVLDVIDVPVCEQQKFGMDIEGTEPFTRTIRCVEQDPSIGCFKQITIGFENSAAKRFVTRRSHRNEVFECSAGSVVYVYPTMPPEPLLLMQKLMLHKTKTRVVRRQEAQSEPIFSRRLALRLEFCEYLKPLFYQ